MTEERTGSESERTVKDGTLRHDLLTPVNHILGYGEMIQEEAESMDQPLLSEGVAEILRAGKEVLGEIHRVHPGGGVDYLISDLQNLRDRLPGLMVIILHECERVREVVAKANDGSLTRDLERIELAAARLKSMVERRIGDLLSDESHLAD